MGFEQPALGLEVVPVHDWWLELDDLEGPFKPKPFCNSISTRIKIGRDRSIYFPLEFFLSCPACEMFF